MNGRAKWAGIICSVIFFLIGTLVSPAVREWAGIKTADARLEQKVENMQAQLDKLEQRNEKRFEDLTQDIRELRGLILRQRNN